MGLFPSSPSAPRVVVTNGMMIPNYSKPDDWEKFNALGVTQYGQMTAGSYMYIGPQGIVHGTTITVMNAARMLRNKRGDKTVYERAAEGLLFVTAGLGGMSGAQPKAGNIAGCVSITAEVNPKAATKRFEQGWVDELIDNIDTLCTRVQEELKIGKAHSFAFIGNIVEVWEVFAERGIHIDLGSDQTSLHNPWAGGYYPAGLSFDQANDLMAADPEKFKEFVQDSLRRHAAAVNKHTAKGTYFFDYGNAFLLEASRAGADVMATNQIDFKYPSYVQDILGPMCFDFGFGPFRWVCASGDPKDLEKTDAIACSVLEKMMQEFELDDNQFVSLNESLNDLSYFIKKNFYSGNDEFYYNEEYKIKDLLKICQYYGIAKNVKASKCKKQDIISTIIYFESLQENYEIVEKRHKMWAYMMELLEDPKMRCYLLF
jgi:urocanate hydratase